MKNSEMPASPILTVNGAYQKEGKSCIGFSKLEYACIHLGVPKTGDPDLDAVIREAAEMRKPPQVTVEGVSVLPSLITALEAGDE